MSLCVIYLYSLIRNSAMPLSHFTCIFTYITAQWGEIHLCNIIPEGKRITYIQMSYDLYKSGMLDDVKEDFLCSLFWELAQSKNLGEKDISPL